MCIHDYVISFWKESRGAELIRAPESSGYIETAVLDNETVILFSQIFKQN